jgi:hypothetical protein
MIPTGCKHGTRGNVSGNVARSRIIVTVGKQYLLLTYWSVRACVHLGSRTRGRMHVALLIQHATPIRHIVTSFVAIVSTFFGISHKRCNFRTKVIKHKMCFHFLHFCVIHLPC